MANPNPSPSTRFQKGNRAAAGPRRKSFSARLRDALEKTDENGRAVADILADLAVAKMMGRKIKDKNTGEEKDIPLDLHWYREVIDRAYGKSAEADPDDKDDDRIITVLKGISMDQL